MTTYLSAVHTAAPRVALMTGATNGIGHDVARRLLAEGMTVIVHGPTTELAPRSWPGSACRRRRSGTERTTTARSRAPVASLVGDERAVARLWKATAKAVGLDLVDRIPSPAAA